MHTHRARHAAPPTLHHRIRRRATILAVQIAFAVAAGVPAIVTDQPMILRVHQAAATTPAVIAHRGYTGDGATENTTAAFTAAADRGADAVEFDVRFSSTGYPVIMHDATVDRTTTGTGRVDSMTVSRFVSLTTDDGGHPPTLWAALNAAKQGGVRSLVELKTVPTSTEWDRFMSKIPSGYADEMTIQSFHSQAIWDARRHGFPMVRLLHYATTADWALKYDGEAAPYQDFTAGGIATLHEHGVKAYGWTVDDSAWWPKLTDMGIDGIITNANPADVKAAIGGAA